MEYKKIAVLGAGAVGSYVIWGLSEKKGIDLAVIAKGERAEKLRSQGLQINDRLYKPAVQTPEEAHGADLLIIALKYGALREALDDIRTVADNHTDVISLMNGVDSEKIISEVIPSSQIIYSLIKVASARKGSSIHFDPETTIGIIYGEIDRERPRDRMEALDRLFAGTGLHYWESSVIKSEIWSKFLLNVGNNLPQAVIGCGVGAYEDSEHVNFLRLKLREEVIRIAGAEGVDITLAAGSSMKGSKVPKSARYSTLQDLDAGRHTEVDMFAGVIVRMGRELGIPTPYNEFMLHMIHAIEEKNDGKFNY
ncbi:MAG: ketopantoate reductase family protein [Eubacterium sp.]|nr:ketopantoate reductase family protein [Eubacterium sp.]